MKTITDIEFKKLLNQPGWMHEKKTKFVRALWSDKQGRISESGDKKYEDYGAIDIEYDVTMHIDFYYDVIMTSTFEEITITNILQASNKISQYKVLGSDVRDGDGEGGIWIVDGVAILNDDGERIYDMYYHMYIDDILKGVSEEFIASDTHAVEKAYLNKEITICEDPLNSVNKIDTGNHGIKINIQAKFIGQATDRKIAPFGAIDVNEVNYIALYETSDRRVVYVNKVDYIENVLSRTDVNILDSHDELLSILNGVALAVESNAFKLIADRLIERGYSISDLKKNLENSTMGLNALNAYIMQKNADAAFVNIAEIADNDSGNLNRRAL